MTPAQATGPESLRESVKKLRRFLQIRYAGDMKIKTEQHHLVPVSLIREILEADALLPPPVQEDAGWPEREKDLYWLERQRYSGHCGESTSEAIQRGRVDACIDRILLAIARSGSAGTAWQDIATAPKEEHVIVVSKRFPEPHEAFQYSDGWKAFSVNGPMSDDPTIWQPLPAPPPAGAGK